MYWRTAVNFKVSAIAFAIILAIAILAFVDVPSVASSVMKSDAVAPVTGMLGVNWR